MIRSTKAAWIALLEVSPISLVIYPAYTAPTFLPTFLRAKSMPIITQRMVDTRKLPSSGQTIIRDDQLPGFAMRLCSKNSSFVVECRVNGSNKRITLGKTTLLTVDEARLKAREWLGQMSSGLDP